METKSNIIKRKKFTPKKLINVQKRNIAYLNVLSWVLIIRVVLDFINTLFKKILNFTSTTQITTVIYIIALIISMFVVIKYNDFKIKGVIIFSSIIMFFAINFIIFENSRRYLLDKNMVLIYIYYLPVSIFVVGSIKDWNITLDIFRKFAYIAVLLSTLGIMAISYSDILSYMEFSYSLLPFNCFLYYAFRQNFKLITFFIFIIGVIDIIVFGARAPVLFLFVFIVLYEIIRLRETKVFSKITIILICMILTALLALFNVKIPHLLVKLSVLTNSRFIVKMLNQQLLTSHSRELIYEEANYALNNIGINIYGLFGDRLLVNAIYVHNIFYELLLSFGYIAGGISILALLFIIIKPIIFNKNRTLKILATLFTTSLFLRYLVSGSFVIEGYFYIYISIMVNICIKAKEKIEYEKS